MAPPYLDRSAMSNDDDDAPAAGAAGDLGYHGATGSLSPSASAATPAACDAPADAAPSLPPPPPSDSGADSPLGASDDPSDSEASRARSRRVRAAILAEDARLRAAWPLLRAEWQSAVAAALWAACLLTMALLGAGYARGMLPAWAVIPCAALAASLLHELEHDLIHGQYFRGRPMSDVMLAGIWAAKLSLNPWTRRGWHLNHHRRSGQVDDVEERMIGLGVRSFAARAVISVLPWVGVLLVRRVTAEAAAASGGRAPRIRHRGALCSLERLVEHVDTLFLLAPALAAAAVAAGVGGAAARAFLVAWAVPNVLRHFCLVTMSSLSHYYEDIAPGDVSQQNQILRHWALTPLQLFCANFGAEHVIHHYVVHQPFWMRHFVRHRAWQVLEAKCVRRRGGGGRRAQAPRRACASRPSLPPARAPRLAAARASTTGAPSFPARSASTTASRRRDCARAPLFFFFCCARLSAVCPSYFIYFILHPRPHFF